MKKRILSVALIVILMLSITAHASTPRVNRVGVTLSFSGTTASCELSITAKPTDKISATMELWQGATLLKTWTYSKTGYCEVSETYSVTKGKSYTVKISGTIAGVAFTAPAKTGTCK